MAWINILDTIYPVGSIYLSTLSISPAKLFGGEWTSITSAVLRGIDIEEKTGYIGEDSHILTIQEMPSHVHGFNTNVNGTTKPYWANSVSNAGYSWTNVFTGPDTVNATNVNRGNNNSGTPLVGGDEPHTNIQRSYNCYIWYRTAQFKV